MAFRGQYIFVTDDEQSDGESPKPKSKRSSRLSKLSAASSNKSFGSKKSIISRSTRVLSRQASDDEYYEDYRDVYIYFF